MKKTVIIIIAVIYVASVLIVNFFGLDSSYFVENIYVSNIECESITLYSGHGAGEKIESDKVIKETKYFKFAFIDGNYGLNNLNENPNAVVLNCRVYPDNATNKNLKFAIDKKDSLYYFDEAKRTLVVFEGGIDITVVIMAADGYGAKQTVDIYSKVIND